MQCGPQGLHPADVFVPVAGAAWAVIGAATVSSRTASRQATIDFFTVIPPDVVF